jgi:hypothetical protein
LLDGTYTVKRLPPGSYVIQFRLIGYKECLIKDVQIKAGNSTTLDVALEKQHLHVE